MNETHSHEEQDMMTTCIENCVECYAVCTQTASYAIESGSTYKPELISLLQDCAKICQTSADFMLRDSQNHVLTCGVCADICTQCAEMCEAESEDELLQACAEVCRECAQSCQEMASE